MGKSTVSSNLALALVKTGARVGLLDADIYGPSIPRMFGALNQKPELDSNRKLLPIERLGVRLMSIGFLVDEELAVVWRGPMLFKAMDQFFRDVAWGELDYLLIDLPPGTGDIQLSLAQKVPVAGAIAVTTPQNVALTDVKKAIDMWTRTGVPILGMVENMAWLEQNGQRVQLFPRGSLESYLAEKIMRSSARFLSTRKLRLVVRLEFLPLNRIRDPLKQKCLFRSRRNCDLSYPSRFIYSARCVSKRANLLIFQGFFNVPLARL